MRGKTTKLISVTFSTWIQQAFLRSLQAGHTCCIQCASQAGVLTVQSPIRQWSLCRWNAHRCMHAVNIVAATKQAIADMHAREAIVMGPDGVAQHAGSA